MHLEINEIPHLKGYTIEWAEPGRYLISRNNELYSATDIDGELTLIGNAGAPFWRQAAANFRPLQRLLRFMYYNAVPLGDEVFVTFDKSVGVFRDGRYVALGGMPRPFRVLRAGCAVDADGSIYFGEYIPNDDRSPLNIYRYAAGNDAFEIAATLPAGYARHIHGIYRDDVTGRLFCLMGDADHESRIIATSDGFATYEEVGGGDESWRAVSILFDSDAFYYGTDAEYRDNVIYRVNRSTGDRTELGTVNGTVFYSKRVGREMFFATTAENAPSQTDNVAAIWHLDYDGQLSNIASFPKDALPGGLFMFGTIHFPHTSALADRLYAHLVGVRGDAKTYEILLHS
jgi:hypothetical protein